MLSCLFLSSLLSVAPFAGAWIEILLNTKTRPHLSVAPFAGAWIEISDKAKKWFLVAVAPFAGAWIEMYCHQKYILRSRSLPSRERGLKSCNRRLMDHQIRSLPSRERGLKLLYPARCSHLSAVAPFAGAWIEITLPIVAI